MLVGALTDAKDELWTLGEEEEPPPAVTLRPAVNGERPRGKGPCVCKAEVAEFEL